MEGGCPLQFLLCWHTHTQTQPLVSACFVFALDGSANLLTPSCAASCRQLKSLTGFYTFRRLNVLCIWLFDASVCQTNAALELREDVLALFLPDPSCTSHWIFIDFKANQLLLLIHRRWDVERLGSGERVCFPSNWVRQPSSHLTSRVVGSNWGTTTTGGYRIFILER